jgi:hypothetical protein
MRAAQLNLATPEDAAFLLNDFQLRTILDLRSPAPLQGHVGTQFQDAVQGRVRPPGERVRITVPMLTDAITMSMVVRKMSLTQKLQSGLYKVLALLVGLLRRVLAALPLLRAAAEALAELERRLSKQMRLIGLQVFSQLGLNVLYLSMLRQGQAPLKSALREAVDPANHPLVFHCQFGKDRTGLLAALILHSAGVRREVILADYGLSDGYVDTPRGAQEWQEAIRIVPPLADNPDDWCVVRPALRSTYCRCAAAARARSPTHVLKSTLEAIEAEYGSLDGYLDSIGLGPDWRRGVRLALVEPS